MHLFERPSDGTSLPSPDLTIELDPNEAKQKKREREYRLHVIQIPALRLFGFAVLTLLVALHNLFLLHSFSWSGLARLTAIVVPYCLLSWLILYLLYRRVKIINLGDLFLTLDLAAFALMVYFSGGEKSWLFFLVLARVADQTNTSFKRVFYFAHLSVLSYLLMILYLIHSEHRPIIWSSELAKIVCLYSVGIYISLTAQAAEQLRSRTAAAIRTARDSILRLKEQSTALQETGSRFREMFDEAPIGYHELDSEGRIVAVNRTELAMLGYTAEEMMGKHAADFVQEKEAAKKAVAAKLAGTQPLGAFERTLARKDGTLLPVLMEDRLIRNAEGRITGIRTTVQDLTPLKKAEAAQHESERRLRQLFEGSRDAIFVEDLEGNVLDANPAACRLHGMEREELVGKNVVDLVPPEERERVARDFPSQAKGGIDFIEGFSWTKDGRAVPVEIRVSRVYYSDRPAVLLHVRDITERKRAEEALRESEARFRELFDEAPVGYHELDAEGRIVRVNRTELAMLGYTPEEMLGRHPFEFVLEKEASRRGIEGKLAGIEPLRTVERTYVRKDGSLLPVLIEHRHLRNAQGEITGLLSTLQDLSDRKQAEREIQIQKAYLENLFESAPEAIVVLDKNDFIIRINSEFTRLFGYTRDEALGRAIDDLIVPEELREEAVSLTEKVTHGGKVSHETVRRRKDGTLVDVSILGTPINLEGGRIAVYGIYRDITERKRVDLERAKARDAALETARLKSEFLANMSHEIRTPMNGIIGMTGLLLGTDLTPEQREFAEVVRSSADALLGIINDILDFSKIEAGKLFFESFPFDVRTVVEDVVGLLAERAHAKGVEIFSQVFGDVPLEVRGDPTRTRQVLTNLVGNAIKFTEQGEVVVQVSRESDTETHSVLRFSVSDTGIGISKESQGRIFQAFAQADGSTTRKYGGTGLGLAISKQLVELMGGEISFESESGRGATFWFTVRYQKVEPSAAVVPKMLPEPEKVRVLIVDDNRTNRQIVGHQLMSWGMRKGVAANGSAALALLRQEALAGDPYTLAILDMQMPEMDGLTLAKNIKADPAIAATKLVMMTSMGRREGEDALRNSGIEICITKPVKQSQLFDCLMTIRPADSLESPPRAADALDGSIDEGVLAALRDLQRNGHRDLLAELIDLYLSDAPPRLQELRAALARKDNQALLQAVHALKSGSGNLGAKRMAELCGKVEELGRNQSFQRISSLVTQLEQEFKRVQRVLEAEKERA